jgi:hypothetical protein
MAVIYRVSPFIGKIKGNQNATEVSSQLESAINQNAANGWEFVESTNVNIEVQPGCLAGLFGAKADYMRFDMLVFRQSALPGEHVQAASSVAVRSDITAAVPPAPMAEISSDNARKMAKKLAALSFSADEIASQLQDRGVPEADAQAIARVAKGG